MPAGLGNLPWLNAVGGRHLSLVRQSTTTECGLACVAMIARYHGKATDLIRLRRAFAVSSRGVTLRDLIDLSRSLALSARAVRCDVPELSTLQKPCILHWRFDHFVVLKSVGKKTVVVHDPARGVVKVTMDAVRESFTGVALELKPSRDFSSEAASQPLRLRNLLSNDHKLVRMLLAGLSLALVGEILTLMSPLYLQLVIDRVLSRGDVTVLPALALAFSLMLCIHVLANVMRQLTFLFLGSIAAFDMMARITRRLMRLPLRFFRDRELGDIQHRIQAMNRIQGFIMNAMPALILDGLFVVTICLLMLQYETKLTVVVVCVFLAWCAWSFMILPLRLQRSSDIAQAEAAVQTDLLESLRTISSIKAANGEQMRESGLQILFADSTNARIRAANLRIAEGGVRQVLFQGMSILVIYTLAKLGLEGRFSVGMLSSYVAYIGMFASRSCGIVDRLVEYKLLQVPLSRLADIVFSEEEPQCGLPRSVSVLDIELCDVSLRYSETGSYVLQQCDAVFRESSFTAIAGVSGAGKSSLLQLIAGFVSPSSGSLMFNGQPSCHWSPQDLRASMALILQGDSLFMGSIAENIAVFESTVDTRRVRQAARDAGIAADIDCMPMRYETRIGDLGASLSRGQVQRVLLARAFYRQSKLLLLDEASSGLDANTEKTVIASLTHSSATKIVVTHSDQMLQAADAVLWLHQGRLLSSRPELNL